MSQNGGPHQSDASENPAPLEIYIETVMGTTFEVNALPNDSILSIKLKISRYEGIPSSQQHLLYNMKELDNSSTINNYSIQDGATLKLIVSMRVGPITTKRFPEVDELAWRELQELLSDYHKDDLYDRLPPGTKLTVLIFQDGDQVHFLKVLEHEDGTFSPMADAWNGSSIRTLYSRRNHQQSDDVEEDNSVTMAKMQELKERLEALSLQRKEKKNNDTDPNAVRRCRRMNGRKDNLKTVRVVSYLNGGMKNLPFPTRKSQKDIEAADGYRSRMCALSFSRLAMASLNKVRREAEIMFKIPATLSALLDSGSKRPPLPEIRRSSTGDREKITSQDDQLGKNLEEKTTGIYAAVEEKKGVSLETSACSLQSPGLGLPSKKEIAAGVSFAPLPRDTVSTHSSGSIFKLKGCALENDEVSKAAPAPALTAVQAPACAPTPVQTLALAKTPIGTLTLAPASAMNSLQNSASAPGSQTRIPVGRLTLTLTPGTALAKTPSQTPASAPAPVETLTLTLTSTPVEVPNLGLCSVQIPGLASAPVETMTLTLTPAPDQTPADTPVQASAPNPTQTPAPTLTVGQPSTLGRPPPRRVTLTLTPSKLDGEKPGIGRTKIFPDPNKGLLSQLSHIVPITKVVTYDNGIRKEWRPQEVADSLPPKASNPSQGYDPGQQPSVKKHMRCLKCKKKVNITNTYSCRCGGSFCSVHRYSEVHDCPFDYKRQCKKPLWQANSLFAAHKLPKI